MSRDFRDLHEYVLACVHVCVSLHACACRLLCAGVLVCAGRRVCACVSMRPCWVHARGCAPLPATHTHTLPENKIKLG